MLTFERLVAVVRKQLSMSIAHILTNNYKLKTSVITNAVAIVASPVTGCFKNGSNSDREEVRIDVQKCRIFSKLGFGAKNRFKIKFRNTDGKFF